MRAIPCPHGEPKRWICRTCIKEYNRKYHKLRMARRKQAPKAYKTGCRIIIFDPAPPC